MKRKMLLIAVLVVMLLGLALASLWSGALQESQQAGLPEAQPVPEPLGEEYVPLRDNLGRVIIPPEVLKEVLH